MRTSLLLTLTLTTACESLVGSRLTVEVTDATAADFSEDAPGVVYVEDRGIFRAALVLCGDTPEAPETVHQSDIGCIQEGLDGTSASFRATIRPANSDWNTSELCDLEPAEGLNRGLNLADEWFGTEPASVEEPGPTWDTADGTATWNEDGFGGCGGTLIGEVSI